MLRSVLHLAAQYNLPDILTALLSTGMEVDGRDIASRTPLHYASSQGHLEVCRILLQHRADINASDKGLGTPLYYAARMGHVEVVKLLLATSHIDVNSQTISGNTPLMSALRYGRDTYKPLLAHPDVKVDLLNGDKETALHWAVRYGPVVSVEALLPRSAGILNLLDNRDYHVLHLACFRNEETATDMVKLLLQCEGIDAGRRGAFGETPLHQAAGEGYLPACRLLAVRIDSGILRRDVEGNTPLDIAAGRVLGDC